jgi:hypothetical protein
MHKNLIILRTAESQVSIFEELWSENGPIVNFL